MYTLNTWKIKYLGQKLTPKSFVYESALIWKSSGNSETTGFVLYAHSESLK